MTADAIEEPTIDSEEPTIDSASLAAWMDREGLPGAGLPVESSFISGQVIVADGGRKDFMSHA